MICHLTFGYLISWWALVLLLCLSWCRLAIDTGNDVSGRPQPPRTLSWSTSTTDGLLGRTAGSTGQQSPISGTRARRCQCHGRWQRQAGGAHYCTSGTFSGTARRHDGQSRSRLLANNFYSAPPPQCCASYIHHSISVSVRHTPVLYENEWTWDDVVFTVT